MAHKLPKPERTGWRAQVCDDCAHKLFGEGADLARYPSESWCVVLMPTFDAEALVKGQVTHSLVPLSLDTVHQLIARLHGWVWKLY